MEPTEAYEVLCYVPARSLPYNQPGTCYTLVALPKEDPTAGEHFLDAILALWEGEDGAGSSSIQS
jgi:hypothetical protein